MAEELNLPEPTLDDILTQYQLRSDFWAPRDRRMEFWHQLYLLIDAHQLAKPPGRQRFVSNDPANIVDKGAHTLAKNDLRLMAPIDDVNDPYERSIRARYEDLGYGIFDEIDEALERSGASGSWRDITAMQALLRGWVSGCLILRPDDEDGMVFFDDWDPRFVYPDFARNRGMRSVVYYTEDHLGAILSEHPWLEEEFTADDDMQQLVKKYIWYDREWYGCVAELPHRSRNIRARAQNAYWISRDPDGKPGPYRHGLPDIPAYMVPVNGLNFRYAPTTWRDPLQDLQFSNELRQYGSRYDMYRYGSNHWVADRGRSIFANAEKEFRQFNELVATVWQVVANEALGTWVLRTRDGKAVELEIGNNAVNFLRLDEQLEKINPHLAPPNITDLLSISGGNIENATFSFKMFGNDFEGSGFLFNQAQEAMAQSLGPYKLGMERGAQRLVRIGTRQFRLGGFENQEFSVRRPASRKIFHASISSSDFDRDYPMKAELKLAVPEDLLSRVQIAKLLADPRRPLASLQTIFDKVLGWDDPDGEKEKIFEDVADTDPVIVLERTAQALEKRGLPELATNIRDKEFVLKAVQAMQKAQAAGQLQQILGGGGDPTMADAAAGGQTVSPPNPTSNAPTGADISATGAAGGPF